MERGSWRKRGMCPLFSSVCESELNEISVDTAGVLSSRAKSEAMLDRER